MHCTLCHQHCIINHSRLRAVSTFLEKNNRKISISSCCHAWGQLITLPYLSIITKQVQVVSYLGLTLTNTAMSNMINISCPVSIIWRLNGVARSTIHIKQNISRLVTWASVGPNRVYTNLRASAILWTISSAFNNIYKTEQSFLK